MPSPRSQQAKASKRRQPKTAKPERMIVVSLDDATGNINVVHRGVSMFESPTVLRRAAQIVEQKLGLRE